MAMSKLAACWRYHDDSGDWACRHPPGHGEETPSRRAPPAQEQVREDGAEVRSGTQVRPTYAGRDRTAVVWRVAKNWIFPQTEGVHIGGPTAPSPATSLQAPASVLLSSPLPPSQLVGLWDPSDF